MKTTNFRLFSFRDRVIFVLENIYNLHKKKIENKKKIYLKNWGFSQLRMCVTPSPLIFNPVFMDDAQCAETNEKSIFRFLFFELS